MAASYTTIASRTRLWTRGRPKPSSRACCPTRASPPPRRLLLLELGSQLGQSLHISARWAVYAVRKSSVTWARRDLGATLPSPSCGAAPGGRPSPKRLEAARRHACSRSESSLLASPPYISTQWLHSMFPQPRAPAAMTSMVQLSEPQPEAYAKDSAIAVRRAAAGRIGRTAVLCVCPRCHSVRGICYNLRSCYLVECMREKMAGIFTQPCS